MNRGPIAQINLASLAQNLRTVRKITKSRPTIAVVKADAYGHGSVPVARKLLSEGVSCLAVAFTAEAKVLRNAGIDSDILVLFDDTDVEDYFDYRLIPVVHELRTARALSKEARRRNTTISVHLKIDTGMGRIGFRPEGAIADALKVAGMEGIEICGILSHFSEADLADRSFAVRQIDVFDKIKREISTGIGRPILSHMGNSAAIMTLKEALFDAVRPGIMLYGCSPLAAKSGLRPVMTVKTKVLAVRSLPSGTPVSYGRTFVTKRRSRIAVVTVGYADGYSRSLSNRGEVLIRGRRAPVAGRVCMDLTMVDVTGIGGVSPGDDVVLMGTQGNDSITAHEIASKIGTIPYEVVLSLGSRARREYTG